MSLTVDVIIAGHDRRHSGGKPELPASERRKRLLPFQLTAAAEEERMCNFDELDESCKWPSFITCTTLEMVAVAVVAEKPWTTHRSVCQIWSYSEDLDVCKDISDQQNMESKHVWKQRITLLVLSGGKFSSGSGNVCKRNKLVCWKSISQPERNTVATQRNGLKPQWTEQQWAKIPPQWCEKVI